ncbi:hypothetical protein ACTFIY_000996 [Dictyostelium cf. discoideum]
MSRYSKLTINDFLLNQELLEKKNKYSCPICFEYFYKKSVYQCRSGHYACKECWEKSLENKKECMLCRSKVKSFEDLSRCLVIEQNFGEKECCCIYSFNLDYFIDGANQENEKRKLIKDEEMGCKEIINVDQLDTHTRNCKFKFVECSHNGCNRILRSNSLKEHENICVFKLVLCGYCGGGTILKELENHYDKCSKFPFFCPQGCSIIIERDQIKSHIDNDCNDSIIQCKYYEYGCKVEMKRPELQNHLEKVNHQSSMGKLIDKLSSSLDQSMKIHELLLKEIDKSRITCSKLQEKNDELSSLITKINDNYFNKNDFRNSSNLTLQGYRNKWIISNYSSLVENTPRYKQIFSPTFDILSSEFKVSFYPCGATYLNGRDHISLYLCNNNQELKKVELTLELVNVLDKSNSIKREGSIVVKGHQKAGWSIYLASNLINKNNGWLSDDDKLTINIYVKILNDDDIEPLVS